MKQKELTMLNKTYLYIYIFYDNINDSREYVIRGSKIHIESG